MTTTSFQDDFHREVERQSKEAEGIQQTAFNRRSPAPAAATDEQIARLEHVASDPTISDFSANDGTVLALIARIKEEREAREKAEGDWQDAYDCLVTLSASVREQTIRECMSIAQQGADNEMGDYAAGHVRDQIQALVAHQETMPRAQKWEACSDAFQAGSCELFVNRLTPSPILPQHDAFNGSAILPHRSENVRMKLPRHPEPKPNKLENASRGSNTILIARYNPVCGNSSLRRSSLSMSGHPDYSPDPGGLFPRLISTGQYLQGEVSKSFPIISTACQGVVSVLSILCSLVIHDPKSVMEKGEKHGKFVGVFKNDRRESSVRNPSKANSTSGPLPVSGRAHPPRF